jgi:hypothetical protein
VGAQPTAGPGRRDRPVRRNRRPHPPATSIGIVPWPRFRTVCPLTALPAVSTGCMCDRLPERPWNRRIPSVTGTPAP